MTNYETAVKTLTKTYKNVEDTAKASKRHADSIQVLAVSKRQNAYKVRALYLAGQTSFGESYLQEALAKKNLLADLAIEWHFIGKIQSRKAKEIARMFHWVHTVDQESLLPKLNDGAKKINRSLQICLQVNISNEASKNGISAENGIDDILPIALAINDFPYLCLRGLMAIPKPVTLPDNYEKKQAPFEKLALLHKLLRNQDKLRHHPLDTLSMGMSDDYPVAIAAGATIIRLGTALFGERKLIY